MVRIVACHAIDRGSIPLGIAIHSRLAQLVERHAVNVMVVGSNPTSRATVKEKTCY